MSEYTNQQEDWYSTVRSYTERLVQIRSVSPGTGEIPMATEVMNLLCEGALQDAYTFCEFDPIKGDPYRRQNTYAFLQGSSKHTLLLCGHLDTVDTQSYAALEPWACDPKELSSRLAELCILAPEISADLARQPNDWLFGRGVLDMKSGLAIAIAVMRKFAEQIHEALPPLSLLFLATADEENESAGIQQAVRFLLQLRTRYGLEYVGAINLDWTTARYPDDPHRYIYSGSIGKLLPGFLVVGKEAHAGIPFDGIDAALLAAELIRNLSMNNDFCDLTHGQMTPPPVILHVADLKKRYDIQLPSLAHFHLNVLTFTTTPQKLLLRLKQLAEKILAQTLAHIDTAEQQWIAANTYMEKTLQSRNGIVQTYAELYEAAVQKVGKQQVIMELTAEEKRWPLDIDKRERCLHLVHRLWLLSGKQGPAIIIYYAPPYYPHVPTHASTLYEAVLDVIEANPQHKLMLLDYFPFLSDMSYLQLDAEVDLSALRRNMPIWKTIDATVAPDSYCLPLEEILQLQIPVVNIGPYGHGAHQVGERVLMSYSFEIVPQLLYETIKRLSYLLGTLV